jgi:hypothetical protein
MTKDVDMSELPQIDGLKVAERVIQKQDTVIEKLINEAKEARIRETQLELLAEALRDQRDALRESLTDENDEEVVEGKVVK